MKYLIEFWSLRYDIAKEALIGLVYMAGPALLIWAIWRLVV